MRVDWTNRGALVSDRLRGKVERQLGKFDRFLRGDGDARVVVTQEGDDHAQPRHTVEIIVRDRLGTFTSKQEGHDLVELARGALDRIEAQIQRAHDKAVHARRRGEDVSWSAPADAEVS